MVLTRSQRKEITEPVEVLSNTQSADRMTPQKYGRGCRQRRQTHFYEEEVLDAAIQKQSSRRGKRSDDDTTSTSSDDDDKVVFNKRFPERAAAKRAMERLHNLVDEEEEEERRPPPRQNRTVPVKRQDDAKKRAREDSPASSAIATPSTDSAESDVDSDSSAGIVDDRDAHRALVASKKQLPLDRLVGNMVKESHQSPKKKHESKDAHRSSAEKRVRADHGSGARGGEDKDGSRTAEDTLGDITPLPVDPSITFANVGGLPEHIIALREMIMLPLLYPKVLSDLGVSPPKGVLFVGPPGTGKTLMARAVANESQLASQRKVSFFMRKGADILSKWVGESEKQLRLLFDEARKHQPSIIFFDEIDGLAPVRHSKQEQSHAALVSTLLALMDGLDDRGQVIVIGATNRPDTLDPALRRPGRFDRELRFPVPNVAARRHIVKIHTSKMKLSDVPEERGRVEAALLAASEGWTGADIQACCTEATLHALRTKLPQLFVSNARLKVPQHRLAIVVTEDDVVAATMRLAPSLRRAASATAGGTFAPPILEHLDLLLHSCVQDTTRAIADHWGPAAALLRDAEFTKTDDMQAAVRHLNAAPLPHIPRGALSLIVDKGRAGFAAAEASKGLAKHLSHFPAVHVAVSELLRGTMMSVHVNSGAQKGPSAFEEEGGPTGDSMRMDGAMSVSHLFYSIRTMTPCILFFHDVDGWLAALDADADVDPAISDANIALWRNELVSALQSLDLLVVVPLMEVNVARFEQVLLGTAASAKIQHGQLLCAPTFVSETPAFADRERWVAYLWRCATTLQAMLVKQNEAFEQFPIDDSPPPPLSPRTRRAEHERQKVLWNRVEYKRRQLRHLLAQWLSQFIATRRFQVLLSPDLDLTEDSALWKEWQKHVRGRRIGLQDVMEKLENEEYACLSQYVADIEQICSNVRTFFTSRSVADQKYRHRAMELKETTVLNMYKIHKNVTSFCEEHKDMCEPISSSEEEEDSSSSEGDADAANPSTATKPKRAPKRHFGQRRRRKQQRPQPKPADAATAEHPTGGNEGEGAAVVDASATPLRSELTAQSSELGTTPSSSGKSSSRTTSGSVSSVSAATASRATSQASSGKSSKLAPTTPQARAHDQAHRELFPNGKIQGTTIAAPDAGSNAQQLQRWCVDATAALGLEQLHFLTIRLLRGLDAWRWETENDDNRARLDALWWAKRFARLWCALLPQVVAQASEAQQRTGAATSDAKKKKPL